MVKLSGISFPDGTSVFGTGYAVHVDKDKFEIRKSRGFPLLYILPLIDLIPLTLYLMRQRIAESIAAAATAAAAGSPATSQAIVQVVPFLTFGGLAFECAVIYVVLRLLYRTRPWHATEHKAIAAAEMDDLDNISKYSRINDRCGGCYILTIYVAMALWFFIVKIPVGLMTLTTVVLYTEARFFHKYNKVGIWFGRKLQLLTTKEPEPEMLEMGERGVRALMVRMRNEPVEKPA